SRSTPALLQHELDLGNLLARIQPLGTGARAIQNGVATIHLERVFERIQALRRGLVATVDQPAMGLQQCRRTEEAITVPPVAGAAGGAAKAENAFVVAVKLGALGRRLAPFTPARRWRLRLQPWLDGFVLRERMALIADQILDHVQVVERINSNWVFHLVQRADA